MSSSAYVALNIAVHAANFNRLMMIVSGPVDDTSVGHAIKLTLYFMFHILPCLLDDKWWGYLRDGLSSKSPPGRLCNSYILI